MPLWSISFSFYMGLLPHFLPVGSLGSAKAEAVGGRFNSCQEPGAAATNSAGLTVFPLACLTTALIFISA